MQGISFWWISWNNIAAQRFNSACGARIRWSRTFYSCLNFDTDSQGKSCIISCVDWYLNHAPLLNVLPILKFIRNQEVMVPTGGMEHMITWCVYDGGKILSSENVLPEDSCVILISLVSVLRVGMECYVFEVLLMRDLNDINTTAQLMWRLPSRSKSKWNGSPALTQPITEDPQ